MQDMLFRNDRVRAQPAHAGRDDPARPQSPFGARMEHRQRERLPSRTGLRALHPAGERTLPGARPDPSGRHRVPRLSDGRAAVALHGARRAGCERLLRLVPGPRDRSRIATALGAYLDRLHSDYPASSFVRDGVRRRGQSPGPATEKGTFEFQRDFLAYHLGVFAQRPYINAALIWILRDFRVKPFYDGGSPTPEPPNNRKGLVDYAGTRKPAFQTVQELFKGATDGDQ